jgi:protocatechuate 3,4-dioxygenase, alpha subunit
MTDLVLTPSQTSGPLFGFSLLFPGCDRAADPDDPRTVCVTGRVIIGGGSPYAHPHGLVEVWHGEQWARARTDADGGYRVYLSRPAPSRTPDGQPLAPAFTVAVFGVGLLKQFVTRAYLPDEDNADDAVLRLVPEADRDRLVGVLAGERTLRFDIDLKGERPTPCFGW